MGMDTDDAGSGKNDACISMEVKIHFAVMLHYYASVLKRVSVVRSSF